MDEHIVHTILDKKVHRVDGDVRCLQVVYDMKKANHVGSVTIKE